MQALAAANAIPSYKNLHCSAKETKSCIKSRSRKFFYRNSQRRPHCDIQIALCQKRFNHGADGDDVDDVFDDLLNKYGKVVYKRGDRRDLGGEDEDDAESLSCKEVEGSS